MHHRHSPSSMICLQLLLLVVTCSSVLVGAVPHGEPLARRHNHGVAAAGRPVDVPAVVLAERSGPGQNESLQKRFDDARYSYYYIDQGPVACSGKYYSPNDYVSPVPAKKNFARCIMKELTVACHIFFFF